MSNTARAVHTHSAHQLAPGGVWDPQTPMTFEKIHICPWPFERQTLGEVKTINSTSVVQWREKEPACAFCFSFLLPRNPPEKRVPHHLKGGWQESSLEGAVRAQYLPVQ